MKLQTSAEILAILAEHEATMERLVNSDDENTDDIRDLVAATGEMKKRLRLVRIEEKLDELLSMARITRQ